MEGDFKIVEFEGFCKKCKYEMVQPDQFPCDDCLGEPGRVDSRRPARFEESKKGRKEVPFQ